MVKQTSNDYKNIAVIFSELLWNCKFSIKSAIEQNTLAETEGESLIAKFPKNVGKITFPGAII